jgi:hypothetical protein
MMEGSLTPARVREVRTSNAGSFKGERTRPASRVHPRDAMARRSKPALEEGL